MGSKPFLKSHSNSYKYYLYDFTRHFLILLLYPRVKFYIEKVKLKWNHKGLKTVKCQKAFLSSLKHLKWTKTKFQFWILTHFSRSSYSIETMYSCNQCWTNFCWIGWKIAFEIYRPLAYQSHRPRYNASAPDTQLHGLTINDCSTTFFFGSLIWLR